MLSQNMGSGSGSAQVAATQGRAISFIAQSGPSTFIGSQTKTADWATGTKILKNVTPSTNTGFVLQAGMYVNSAASSAGISPVTENTIVAVNSGTQITLGTSNSTDTKTTAPFDVSNAKGTLASGSPVITSMTFKAGTFSMNHIASGMAVIGSGIPNLTTVLSKSGTSLTLSANCTRDGQSALIFKTALATTVSSNKTLSNVGSLVVPTVGTVINIPGASVPPGTIITSAPNTLGEYQAGTGTLVISNAPTVSGTGLPLLTKV